MSSAIAPITDMLRLLRHDRSVPSADVITCDSRRPGSKRRSWDQSGRWDNLPVFKRIANLPGVGNRVPKIANAPCRRNDVWDRRVCSHKLFDLKLPAAAALTLAAG
jgi:hypothetical protein